MKTTLDNKKKEQPVNGSKPKGNRRNGNNRNFLPYLIFAEKKLRATNDLINLFEAVGIKGVNKARSVKICKMLRDNVDFQVEKLEQHLTNIQNKTKK